jgi:hypothetical protein
MLEEITSSTFMAIINAVLRFYFKNSFSTNAVFSIQVALRVSL